MSHDHLPDGIDGTPKHELLLEINELASQLVTALELKDEPDIEHKTLFFNAPEHTPDFIRYNFGIDSELTEVTVDSEIGRHREAVEMSVGFSAKLTDGTTSYLNVYISSSHEGYLACSCVHGDIESACPNPVSREELNRFLVSLFLKNKTGDYSMFDEMNLASPHTVERLMDALDNTADETIVQNEYFLGESIGPTMDGIRYLKRDGELVSAVISIEHHAKASALDIQFSKTIDDRTFDDSDVELMVQRLEGAQTYSLDMNGESTAVPSTNDFLIVMRDFIKTKRDGIFVPIDDPLDNDIADLSSEINIEDAKEYGS